MRLIKDCDADTMYLTLSAIGINMRELDKQDPSVQYLRELYCFLLHMQLLAWKSAKSHRQVIRVTNQTLLASKPLKEIKTKK